MKNKLIFRNLLFLMLLISKNSSSQIPLGSRSRDEVVIATITGGLVGAGSFMVLGWLFNDFKFPSLTKFPGFYLFSTIMGAAMGGTWSYMHTPEAYYEYALNNVRYLEHNKLLEIIANARTDSIVAGLKDYFFKEKFPLYVAFTRLTLFFNQLQDCENALLTVVSSHRHDLYEQSHFLLQEVRKMQSLIKSAMIPLKEDTQFLVEYNAQTMQQMQEAQMATAEATQAAALAQWIKPTATIIVNN